MLLYLVTLDTIEPSNALTHILLTTGKKAGRQERALYHPVTLGLPAAAVQAGSAVGQTARRAHADPTCHHQRSVAVHQDTQTPGDLLHNPLSKDTYPGVVLGKC